MDVTTTGFDPQGQARQAEALAERIDRLAHDCRYAASREQMVAISPPPLQDVTMAAELVRRFGELLRSDVADPSPVCVCPEWDTLAVCRVHGYDGRGR